MMKNFLIFIGLVFSFSAVSKTYKIQVFRVSDGKQLYGLYVKEAKKAKRLAEAMLLHNPPLTTLVNEDITTEMDTRATVKTKRKNAHKFLKNYDCKTLNNDFLKALCRVRK